MIINFVGYDEVCLHLKRFFIVQCYIFPRPTTVLLFSVLLLHFGFRFRAPPSVTTMDDDRRDGRRSVTHSHNNAHTGDARFSWTKRSNPLCIVVEDEMRTQPSKNRHLCDAMVHACAKIRQYYHQRSRRKWAVRLHVDEGG